MTDFIIIFDMDGVVINSEPLHQECERELFRELNIILTKAEHDRFLGVSGSYMWKQLKAKFDLKESIGKLVESCERISFAELASSVPRCLSLAPKLRRRSTAG